MSGLVWVLVWTCVAQVACSTDLPVLNFSSAEICNRFAIQTLAHDPVAREEWAWQCAVKI